jgi:hypothetical protein
VWTYEQGRLPDVRQAIGLELIFFEPVQRIFTAVTEEMRRQIAARARALLEGMSDKSSPRNAQLYGTLADLAHIDEEDFTPWKEAV